MKKALLVVLLAGCGRDPMKCEYCHVERDLVIRNLCDICNGVHLSCDTESALRRWDKSKNNYFIMACPPPAPKEDEKKPVQGEVKPIQAEPQPPQDQSLERRQSLMVMGLGMILVALLGYRCGRNDEAAKQGRRYLDWPPAICCKCKKESKGGDVFTFFPDTKEWFCHECAPKEKTPTPCPTCKGTGEAPRQSAEK
jgi:hypothetical protein